MRFQRAETTRPFGRNTAPCRIWEIAELDGMPARGRGFVGSERSGKIRVEIATVKFGHSPIREPEGKEIAVIAVVLTNLAGSEDSDFGGGDG